jgi:hypothetical protein
MRSRRAVLIALALLTMGAALIGCRRSRLSVGLRDTYTSFSGVEQKVLRLEAGETLELDYEVAVETGELTLLLLGPDGETIWREQFEGAEGSETVADASHSGRKEVAVGEESGRYELRIIGRDTKGSFDISWRVEDG